MHHVDMQVQGFSMYELLVIWLWRLYSGHGLLSQVVSSSICWSTVTSHGGGLSSFESNIAGVAVQVLVSYSDFSPGF